MKKELPTIPSQDSPRLRTAVTSSISQGAREYQEDAYGHWADATGKHSFTVVADGAGGHGGGAEAAQAAIEYSAKAWAQSSPKTLADPEVFLTGWMKNAHLAVNEAAAKIPCSARAVVVACLTDGTKAHWVHAGDSRLLRFHKGRLAERTRDDSVVQVLFERGDITEEQMGTHPDQSRLLQSLGGEDSPRPRPGSSAVGAGDVLILCSDGFWEHLKQEELEILSATPPATRQKALDDAVAEAVRRAGAKADNTTAVMISFDEEENGRQSSLYWSVLVLLVALAGFIAAWLWSGRAVNIRGLWDKWMNDSGHSGAQFTPSGSSKFSNGDATPETEPISEEKPLTPENSHD
ncbi:MAG: serine/threonine-protein phosphatase [Akkermansiaceae bacterium]|nr:serine/threonine-protein phosphatase [Akkermansiaceae bacterium]